MRFPVGPDSYEFVGNAEVQMGRDREPLEIRKSVEKLFTDSTLVRQGVDACVLNGEIAGDSFDNRLTRRSSSGRESILRSACPSDRRCSTKRLTISRSGAHRNEVPRPRRKTTGRGSVGRHNHAASDRGRFYVSARSSLPV
jgi:hypothetical protein